MTDGRDPRFQELDKLILLAEEFDRMRYKPLQQRRRLTKQERCLIAEGQRANRLGIDVFHAKRGTS